MVRPADARLIAAKAAIASACLDALPDSALGEVVLRDDQRRIVARAQRALDAYGGCLIGEDVGRGKTFVALCLARQWRSPLLVIPAALRTTWRMAMRQARMTGAILSHEALSRGVQPDTPFHGIVVDESHHFRNPNTRRYASLCEYAATQPLVLLSATPLQNRLRDLAAQIALFLGERAFALGASELARFTIRGDAAPNAALPRVAAPEWVELAADDGRVMRSILALPPPPRSLDAGDAGALRIIGLVRAWASSRAALQAALRVRRRLAAAIEQGVEAGRTPTRREVRAWHGSASCVQLGFASLLMDASASSDDLEDLRVAVHAEHEALARVSAALASAPDSDMARVLALRRIRATHPDSSILVFSEHATTVRAVFAAMRADVGVGMLTSRQACIASGRITREEVLGRFAPVAQGVRAPRAHDRVTLLLTTDLLSEGVNLQDAGIVVHLDLPWNPARLAQRVGRVRRPGGALEVITYLFSPPAEAAALLDAEVRLRRKLADAEGAVGSGFVVLPVLHRDALSTLVVHGTEPVGDNAAAQGGFVARLERWRRFGVHRADGTPSTHVIDADREDLPTAAVTSDTQGWMAALDDGRVVSALAGARPDALGTPIRFVAILHGPARDATVQEVEASLSSLQRHLDAEDLAEACGLGSAAGGRLQRVIVTRLNRVAASIPRHQRADLLPLAARIRDALHHPMSLGAERALARHAQCLKADPRPWLLGAARIVDASARSLPSARGRPKVVGLIVMGPDEPRIRSVEKQ